MRVVRAQRLGALHNEGGDYRGKETGLSKKLQVSGERRLNGISTHKDEKRIDVLSEVAHHVLVMVEEMILDCAPACGHLALL